MIKAVLFDLDGTLVNSLTDLSVCVNKALEKYGFPARPEENYKYYAGNGIPKMIERALPEFNRDEKTVNTVTKEFLNIYGTHFADNTLPYEGMPGLIKELKNREFRLAVVTNKAQEMAERVVKTAYGEVFDLISGKKEGVDGKPNPKTSLEAMEILGVTPKECIFLGDSKVDMCTGVNCGALPVGVLWGFREKDELLQNGAEYIINTPSELFKIIEDKNGT